MHSILPHTFQISIQIPCFGNACCNIHYECEFFYLFCFLPPCCKYIYIYSKHLMELSHPFHEPVNFPSSSPLQLLLRVYNTFIALALSQRVIHLALALSQRVIHFSLVMWYKTFVWSEAFLAKAVIALSAEMFTPIIRFVFSMNAHYTILQTVCF